MRLRYLKYSVLVVVIFLAISNPGRQSFKDFTYDRFEGYGIYDEDKSEQKYFAVRVRTANYLIFSTYNVKIFKREGSRGLTPYEDENYIGITFNFFPKK